MSIQSNKILLFADGPNINEINNDYKIKIDGYTFNPSLFKKNGAKNYLNYCKEILKKCSEKPVSLEVFADEEKDMINQARVINNLGNNIYVKIPIIYTNGRSTLNTIKTLIDENIKLNITAIFLIDQIKNIINSIRDTKTILSIFAGRIYDSGIDAQKNMREINQFVHQNSNCQTLWASTRMSFDYISAINSNTDIITMQLAQIKKLNGFGKSLSEYSRETVQQFFNDAKSCNFKI
jgi:transaldolase